MKKQNNKLGVSLTEITISVLVFALIAIPLYYAISFGSKEEIYLEKVSHANKILESFRDEIKNLDFETVKNFGNNIDGTQLPPNSFQKLFEAQKKFKDFKFSAQAESKAINEIESISFKAEVKWTKDNGTEASQKLSFVKVQ